METTFNTVDKIRGDQELWTGIRNGNEAAFTAVFDLYHGALYNYGFKLCPNASVVEDAVQDVFIDVWRLRSGLTENITSIKFYLYRSLRRRIHTGLNKHLYMEDINEVGDESTLLSSMSIEASLIESEASIIRSQQLQTLLAQLPERQIEALTLRYFEDFKTEEISQIMGVSEKSVRNFIYKALTTLRIHHHKLVIPSLTFFEMFLF